MESCDACSFEQSIHPEKPWQMKPNCQSKFLFSLLYYFRRFLLTPDVSRWSCRSWCKGVTCHGINWSESNGVRRERKEEKRDITIIRRWFFHDSSIFSSYHFIGHNLFSAHSSSSYLTRWSSQESWEVFVWERNDLLSPPVSFLSHSFISSPSSSSACMCHLKEALTGEIWGMMIVSRKKEEGNQKESTTWRRHTAECRILLSFFLLSFLPPFFTVGRDTWCVLWITYVNECVCEWVWI